MKQKPSKNNPVKIAVIGFAGIVIAALITVLIPLIFITSNSKEKDGVAYSPKTISNPIYDSSKKPIKDTVKTIEYNVSVQGQKNTIIQGNHNTTKIDIR